MVERLLSWARGWEGAPFRWGESDCALIVAEAVDLLSGSATAAALRGCYRSRAQALRFQRRNFDLPSLIRAQGFFALAERGTPEAGDILIARARGFACGHVCLGRLSLSAWPELGVGLCKTADLMALPDCRVYRRPC